MALKLPKRVKHRKEHRGRLRGNATRGNTVKFGEFGIQALEPSWITARQIEAGRVAAGHFLAGEGRLWIRIFPAKPITSTPAETRMGKGKGEPEFWAAPVKPGTVMYEVGGIPKMVAKEAMARIAQKLPIRTKLVERKAV